MAPAFGTARRSTARSIGVLAAAALIGLAGGFTTARVDSANSAAAHPPSPTSNEPLYFADGEIHDGPSEVRFVPQVGAHIDWLTRIENGWAVAESFDQQNSRVMLVSTLGKTTLLPQHQVSLFHVSADGATLAIATAVSSTVDLVDVSDDRTTSTVATPFSLVLDV